MAMKRCNQRRYDNDNMVNVVHLDYFRTTHNLDSYYRTYFFSTHKVLIQNNYLLKWVCDFGGSLLPRWFIVLLHWYQFCLFIGSCLISSTLSLVFVVVKCFTMYLNPHCHVALSCIGNFCQPGAIVSCFSSQVIVCFVLFCFVCVLHLTNCTWFCTTRLQ